MMTRQGVRKLTAAILARQIEKGWHGEIDHNRLHESLTTGPDLTTKERALLLLSPVARDDWNRIRNNILDDLRERWLEENLNNELVPLAASGDKDSGQVNLQGSGFSVTLFRQGQDSVSWVILVQLSPTMRSTIHNMTQLRLIDGGGLEWMRGQPDSEGEITAEWEDKNIDLYKRACQYQLKLELI